MEIFRNRHHKDIWFFILGVVVILSFLFTVISQKSQNKLDVYTESDKVEKQPIAEEEELEIASYIHTDKEHHYSIEIPEDWEQVTQDGYDTFIHSASGSSIQVQIKEYDPSVNILNAETVSTQVAEEGYTFVSFEKTDNASYELRYQDLKKSTYDYIERTYWDLDQVITLKCIFNDQNYEKILPYFEKSLASFAWDPQNSIPEGYAIYYSEGIHCEFGFPAEWELGESNGAVCAVDPNSGATETATAQSYTSYLDNVTATDITNLLSSGYNNFMLKSFDTSHEMASAVFTHVIDNVQYTNQTYLFADGQNLVMLSFDYEQGLIDETVPETCAGLFRSFAPDLTEETTDSAHESN